MDKSAPFFGIVGFAIGLLSCFFFFVYPQQQTLMKKDKLLNELYEFNRQEQQRIAQLRDVSESQLKRWVSINEEASMKYQEIFNTLQKQERNYSNPGLYWTTLVLVLVVLLIGLYLYLNRIEDAKDIATLENFEVFIDQRLKQIDSIKPGRLTGAAGKITQSEPEDREPHPK